MERIILKNWHHFSILRKQKYGLKHFDYKQASIQLISFILLQKKQSPTT